MERCRYTEAKEKRQLSYSSYVSRRIDRNYNRVHINGKNMRRDRILGSYPTPSRSHSSRKGGGSNKKAAALIDIIWLHSPVVEDRGSFQPHTDNGWWF